MPARGRVLLFVSALLAAASPARAQDVACGDLARIDASTLTTLVKWDGTDSPPAPGCSSDAASALPGRCDWSSAVTLDRAAGTDRRLVVVNVNHETGSGAWDYVTVYGCEAGKVKALLGTKFLYGAEIKKFTGDKLVIQSAEWRRDDAQCCPSHEKITTYGWNPGRQTYTLAGIVLHLRHY